MCVCCNFKNVYYFRLVHFYVYECFASMFVFAPHLCLMPVEVRRGCQISWNLELRHIDGNLGPLQEQHMLLTAEPSLQPYMGFYSAVRSTLTKVKGCWRDDDAISKVLIINSIHSPYIKSQTW